MKKFFNLGALVLAMVLVLSGCTSTTEGVPETVVIPSVQEIANAMVEKEYVMMPKPIDDQVAQEVYRINLDNVEEYAIADTGRSPGVGLVVIAKAKEGKVEEVKASMEQLLQDKVGSAFYPDEQEAAENAEIRVDGPYVSLFIINDTMQDEAMQMYEAALNGQL